MPTGPDGVTSNTNLAPDGKPFPEEDAPYTWHQSSRERGAYRRPPGARPHETVLAIAGTDGEVIGASTEDLLADILYELRAMRLGMMASGLIEEVKDVDVRVLR